jgi:hypothetical protein
VHRLPSNALHIVKSCFLPNPLSPASDEWLPGNKGYLSSECPSDLTFWLAFFVTDASRRRVHIPDLPESSSREVLSESAEDHHHSLACYLADNLARGLFLLRRLCPYPCPSISKPARSLGTRPLHRGWGYGGPSDHVVSGFSCRQTTEHRKGVVADAHLF